MRALLTSSSICVTVNYICVYVCVFIVRKESYSKQFLDTKIIIISIHFIAFALAYRNSTKKLDVDLQKKIILIKVK